MEYTKGEWKVFPNLLGTYTICANDNYTHIAYAERPDDAQLLSAAKEMHEALHQAKEVMEISQVIHAMMPEVGKEPYLKICAALAKAEGK